MMRALTWALLGATMTLPGCGVFRRGETAPGPYRIELAPPYYTRGTTVRVTVTNTSKADVEYNLCTRQLERRSGSTWIVAYEWPAAGGACTMELRTLRPGESTTTEVEIPAGVPVGAYRVVFTGLRSGGGASLPRDAIASPEFELR
jgi:hypothetical protein